MSSRGPIVFETANDAYISSSHVESFVWVGTTTAGDTAELRTADTNKLIWEGRTDTTNTYQGVSLQSGVSCPGGFKAPILDGGKLIVYLKE